MQITPFVLSTLRDIPGQQRLLPFGTRPDTLPTDDGGRGSPPAAASEEEGDPNAPFDRCPPKHAPAFLDPAEMQAAQAEAARLRAACDLLKGAPKSSRDDPNFMESFFSASRLHFIGMAGNRNRAQCMHARWRAVGTLLVSSADWSKVTHLAV